MEIPIDHKPTTDDMTRLPIRGYYLWNGDPYIKTIKDGHACMLLCVSVVLHPLPQGW